MKEARRILILSLGTGKLDNAEKEAGYKETQYTIEGKPYQRKGEDRKTNFVAEPIIDFFEPDEIFILGTVKSVWHQLYATITTEDNLDKSYLEDDNYKRLVNIEKNEGNGIKTSIERLKEVQKEITGIFNSIACEKWEQYTDKYLYNKPNVHILLTKYGIDSDELKENYEILKSMENSLDEAISYEVTFDITHSFRSLPIYNLIVFNYIKNITKYNITISHIYYGNIDASYELNEKAPIVDLKDLVYVLDLTSGVSEFKDTGNAVSLLPLIDTDDELKTVLNDFDLATQLNAFDRIKKALTNIWNITKEQSQDARYTGIREMIGIVLREKFFGDSNNKAQSLEIESIDDVDLKYMLSIWFFNQNRIGLGLATGLEALRDMNTPAFMSSRNYSMSDERKYRENAETYFIKIAERLLQKQKNEELTDMEIVVKDLGTKLRDYKNIRNIFAHSLENPEGIDLSQIHGRVDEFRDNLVKLKKEYDANRKEYNALFVRQENQTSTRIQENKKCRIIICCSGNCDYNSYSLSNQGTHYDVFYLQAKVKETFFRGITNGRQYQTTEKAFYFSRYIKECIPENYQKIEIILAGIEDVEKEVHFRIFLEQFIGGNNKIELKRIRNGQIEACKKIRLHIVMEEHNNELENKAIDYSTVMEIPLQKLSETNV